MNNELTAQGEFAKVPVDKRKPDLGGSGSKAMIGIELPPTIAYDAINANGNLVCAEKAMSYSPGGFVKINRSALDLLLHDQDAFLLLTLIALRARWKQSKFDTNNLKPGQALIGDYESIGLTRKRYRRAIKKLEEGQIVAFKGANKGTIATILDSSIYDLNLETKGPTEGPDRGHQRATKRATNEEYKNVRSNTSSLKVPSSDPGLASLDVAVAPQEKLVNSLSNVSDKKRIFSDEIKAIAEGMIAAMKSIKPDYSAPKNFTAWHTDIDFMVRLDARTPGLILDVFTWCLADDFWKDKMFSKNPPKYLRSKFDQLEIKMKSKPSQAKPARKFAASSDDSKALKIMEDMSKRAL